MLIYEELSGRMKPAAAEMKSQATLFKRGQYMRQATLNVQYLAQNTP